MTDTLDSNGLSTASYDTILEDIQSQMKSIYAQDGESINFDSSSPDGQLTNIFAQAATDLRELLQEIYNSFDPEKCSGVVQDTRYALNYLFRNGGTYTIQNIDVTCDRTVRLSGLDSAYNDLNAASYTVSDDAGNLWYLIDTTTLEPGTHSLPFRSKTTGEWQSAIGTITNMVTIVLGVTGVTNSAAPTTLGQEQESDLSFRLRRARSCSKASQNNTDAMLSQILDLDGVTDATVLVDDEVWTIVEGGANSDIAEAIYANSCGTPTRGAVSVNIPAVSGQIFSVNFDRPTPVPLYLKFDFKLTVSQDATDVASIKSDIAENLTYALNEDAETSKPTGIASDAITTNGGGGYALNMQISTDGESWCDYIASSSPADKFVVDQTRISINLI